MIEHPEQTELSLGVRDLALALRRVQLKFDLDTVFGAYRLPDGHMLSLRWLSLEYTGDVIEIERDDGYCQLITEPPADLLDPDRGGVG
jgi:hypothetical protein